MLRALNNLFAARLDQKVLPHSVLFSDTSSEEFPDAQACDICKQITLEGLFRGCHHRPISQLMKAGSNECRLCCILQLAYLRAFDPKLDIRNEAVVLEALESHLKNEETLVIRYKRTKPISTISCPGASLRLPGPKTVTNKSAFLRAISRKFLLPVAK